MTSGLSSCGLTEIAKSRKRVNMYEKPSVGLVCILVSSTIVTGLKNCCKSSLIACISNKSCRKVSDSHCNVLVHSLQKLNTPNVVHFGRNQSLLYNSKDRSNLTTSNHRFAVLGEISFQKPDKTWNAALLLPDSWSQEEGQQ